jgi:hypothetical protein
MRVRFMFAWYDLWVGAYWNRDARKLYLFPVPCLGICLDFGPPRWYVRGAKYEVRMVEPSLEGGDHE